MHACISKKLYYAINTPLVLSNFKFNVAMTDLPAGLPIVSRVTSLFTISCDIALTDHAALGTDQSILDLKQGKVDSHLLNVLA